MTVKRRGAGLPRGSIGGWAKGIQRRPRSPPATLNTLDLIGQNDRERTLFEPPRPAQQEP